MEHLPTTNVRNWLETICGFDKFAELDRLQRQ